MDRLTLSIEYLTGESRRTRDMILRKEEERTIKEQLSVLDKACKSYLVQRDLL